MLGFKVMQFNAYTKLLSQIIKENDEVKKAGLVNKLEAIRCGFIPVNSIKEDNCND